MSARPFHNSRSYGSLPSSTTRTALGGHFSARNFRASSRSCFWSSEKSKFMARYSGWVIDGDVGRVERSDTHRKTLIAVNGFRCAQPILRSVQNNHILSRRIGIEPFHQCGAALEPGALVDVALVGKLIAVDRGRLGHQHRPRDPHAAGAFGRLVVHL